MVAEPNQEVILLPAVHVTAVAPLVSNRDFFIFNKLAPLVMGVVKKSKNPVVNVMAQVACALLKP